MSESWGSWSEIDAHSAVSENATTETTTPVAKPAPVAKQSKPVATPKAKSVKTAKTAEGPVTISITFSASDHQRVMEKLDGRPARSKLAEIIVESMFGVKE